MYDVEKIRGDFPILSRQVNGKPLTYLDNGASAQKPQVVIDAINQAYSQEYSNVHRGLHYLSNLATEKYEGVRGIIAKFLNAASEDSIILNSGTTEGINMVAYSWAMPRLQAGDEILLSVMEHHANIVPWHFLRERQGVVIKWVDTAADGSLDPQAVLDAITPKTKVISMVHGTNTNGMILPVKEISQMAHEKGILVGVDAAQTAGTFKIDLHDLECDFYAGSAHKFMFGPKGTGVFYARKDSQKHLKPLIVSRAHFRDKSIRRLENYNTRNYPEMLGMGTAVDYYNLIGAEKREARLRDLKQYFRGKLEGDGRFKLKTPGADELSCAIQNVEVVGKKSTAVKTALFEKYMIDCRPIGGFDINGVRISLSVFTTKADVDYLVDALKTV